MRSLRHLVDSACSVHNATVFWPFELISTLATANSQVAAADARLAEQATALAAQAAAAADKEAQLARQEQLENQLATLQSTLEQEQVALQLKVTKAAELKEQLEEAFERMDVQVGLLARAAT